MATDAADPAVVDLDERTVTRTLVCHLETSQRKTDRVRAAAAKWLEMARRFNDLMPGIPEARWGDVQENWQQYLVSSEFPDANGLRAHERNQAMFKVSEAWGSWQSNGPPGDRPRVGYGDATFLRLCHCGVSVEANDRGIGLKASLEPYNPEWFHVAGSASADYLREPLDAVVAGDASLGSAELHVTDAGGVRAHCTVSRDVSVWPADAVARWVGVALGETVEYALAVRDGPGGNGDVLAATVEAGDEFRHHRDRLSAHRDHHQRRGRLDDVRGSPGLRERYTDHVAHRIAADVVATAVEHRPAGIRLRDLTHIRETAAEAIHDWPFDRIQQFIDYKAEREGIPVAFVPAADTARRCRQCGHVRDERPDARRFDCPACGYEIHAKLNAAMNTAAAHSTPENAV